MEPFNYTFEVPTKDFKDTEEKELTVHPIIKDKKLVFVLTIPKYIYDKVFGTEKKYFNEYVEKSYFSPVLDKKVRFRNKLKSELFLDLVNRFDEVCRDAGQVQLVQDSKKNKVILVKFSQTSEKDIDKLNHADKGLRIDSYFQYFICYRRVVKDFVSGKNKNFYESLEQDTWGLQDQHKGYGFKRYYENLDDGFDVVKWTPEREAFFKHIQDSFVKLNSRLADFFGEITEKKVEQLISLHKKSNLLPVYKEQNKE